MPRYYTRACNFYYGSKSKFLVEKKKALPLHGNNDLSFDKVEIISRKTTKKISIKRIKDLPAQIKKTIKKDIKLITKQKKILKI